MGYRQHRTAFELLTNGRLNEVISLQIHGGRGLVQYQHFSFPQQGPGQTNELSLTDAQVFAAFADLVFEAVLKGRNEVFEVGVIQAAPNRFIGMNRKRV